MRAIRFARTEPVARSRFACAFCVARFRAFQVASAWISRAVSSGRDWILPSYAAVTGVLCHWACGFPLAYAVTVRSTATGPGEFAPQLALCKFVGHLSAQVSQAGNRPPGHGQRIGVNRVLSPPRRDFISTLGTFCFGRETLIGAETHKHTGSAGLRYDSSWPSCQDPAIKRKTSRT